MFRRLASAGAGRPVDDNGIPQGPWTPELLAEAISQTDANQSGIELRTVQHWFQDNEKGISSDNIRWLARIFGCDDPEATSQWQATLSAAQARLTARRRRQRISADRSTTPLPSDAARLPTLDDVNLHPVEAAQPQAPVESARRFDLAQRSAELFARRSPLDLPASVFAGAVALGFWSYFLGIHNVTYLREDGVTKQAGFLWAPNWTLLFMVFMPLFFAFTVDLLTFWESEGRSKLLTAIGGSGSKGGWKRKVEASTYTYWTALIVCLGFAGLFQWISRRLIPLLQGGGQYAADWGSLAIVRPDMISVPQAIAFTGLAYLFMCLCFYIFFVGLILLFTITHDFWEIEKETEDYCNQATPSEIAEVRRRVVDGIFRCTVSGLLIAICMKLQSSYLATNAEDILDWLVSDSLSLLSGNDIEIAQASVRTPTHYTSLLIAMLTCTVFLYAFLRTAIGSRPNSSFERMAAAVIVVSIGYLTIGAFSGFSIFLWITVLLAVYGLFDPAFGSRTTH
ncbi:hypothetical protein ILP92_18000 [Maribius pontilimi]|uniref:Transmembrane protein n=1 Tax=Palleronia pontilimi TaxID=1964209 RepID=A0A934IL93_9RHOB|nr:hypothetical protein [Palleronia pontilimi]